MAEGWYVLRVVSGREYRLRDRLAKAGVLWRERERRWQQLPPIETWLPECTLRRVTRRVVTRAKGPLFPCHLLLHLDLATADIGAIEELPGAIGFLRRHEMVWPLDEHDVNRLRDMTSRKGGVIIDAIHGKQISEWIDSPKDTPVKVIGGPYSGWDGLFQEQSGERLKILLDMFNRPVETFISETLVVAA